MGYSTPDIYYNPDTFGLTPVTEIEWDNECYQFNITAVWEKDGEFWMASDSGCSCPSPFENFESLADAEGPYTRFQVIQELTSAANEILQSAYRRDYEKEYISNEITKCIEQIVMYGRN